MNDAERKLKREVSDFFRSTAPTTPELKTQVAGPVEVLNCQAEELCKIVAVARKWLRRQNTKKQSRAKSGKRTRSPRGRPKR